MTMTTTTEDITLRLASLEDAIEDVRAEQRETNARLDALTERTARLEGQVMSISGRLTGMDSRLSDMDATMSAGLSDMRAEIREVNNRMNLMQADTNARLDSIGERMERMQADTNARIDKVFWGVVGVGVTIGGGIIGALVAIAFRIAN